MFNWIYFFGNMPSPITAHVLLSNQVTFTWKQNLRLNSSTFSSLTTEFCGNILYQLHVFSAISKSQAALNWLMLVFRMKVESDNDYCRNPCASIVLPKWVLPRTEIMPSASKLHKPHLWRSHANTFCSYRTSLHHSISNILLPRVDTYNFSRKNLFH